MGEIKSTLDLVMERTRHLSLTNEEKARQNLTAFESRLRGLLQKYSDGILSIDDFQDELALEQKAHQISSRKLVIKAIFDRVDPHQDNRLWIDLIAKLDLSLRDPLIEILADFHQHVADLARVHGRSYLKDLAANRGIMGSAVVPNLDQDADYEKRLSNQQQETRNRIRSLSG